MTILTFPATKQNEVHAILKSLQITPVLEDMTITLKVPTLPPEVIAQLGTIDVKYMTPLP